MARTANEGTFCYLPLAVYKVPFVIAKDEQAVVWSSMNATPLEIRGILAENPYNCNVAYRCANSIWKCLTDNKKDSIYVEEPVEHAPIELLVEILLSLNYSMEQFIDVLNMQRWGIRAVGSILMEMHKRKKLPGKYHISIIG